MHLAWLLISQFLSLPTTSPCKGQSRKNCSAICQLNPNRSKRDHPVRSQPKPLQITAKQATIRSPRTTHLPLTNCRSPSPTVGETPVLASNRTEQPVIGHLAPERGNPLLARARHALDADSPRRSPSFRGISLAGRLQPFVSKIRKKYNRWWNLGQVPFNVSERAMRCDGRDGHVHCGFLASLVQPMRRDEQCSLHGALVAGAD